MICRRQLRDRNQVGVRRQLQAVLLVVLLAESRGADQLAFSRAAIDTQICALRGCPGLPESGRPRPTGPEAPCDHRGVQNPPRVSLTGGNRNAITQLIPLLEAIWAVRDECRGRPLHPSQRLDPDHSYDHDTHRHLLRARPCQ
jgi:hypothetical protein